MKIETDDGMLHVPEGSFLHSWVTWGLDISRNIGQGVNGLRAAAHQLGSLGERLEAIAVLLLMRSRAADPPTAEEQRQALSEAMTELTESVAVGLPTRKG